MVVTVYLCVDRPTLATRSSRQNSCSPPHTFLDARRRQRLLLYAAHTHAHTYAHMPQNRNICERPENSAGKSTRIYG